MSTIRHRAAPAGRKFARMLMLAAAPLALGACDRETPKAANAPAAPVVTVATPARQTMSDHDEYVGRFVAVDAIEVRARVSGYLDVVHFKDGQLVKKGELLFTIDKRPYEATLAQAQGSLAQARANLEFTTADVERAQSLVRGSTITQQTFDQRTQAKKVAEASVRAQEANVRQASLDLEFTELRAPIAGRIGDRRVSAGNLVTGGNGGATTLLATITSIDPIRFEFTVDEASYLRYQRLAGSTASGPRTVGLPARIKLIDEPDFRRIGTLDFVDNTIDRSTGTIRLRAQFANADGLLTPGMFGRIQLAAGPAYEALLVPEAAIGTEQVRKLVLVVDGESIARAKYVTLGPVTNGQRVIASGIDRDDKVIVNGLMRVRPGVRVTPQLQAASADAPATRPTP